MRFGDGGRLVLLAAAASAVVALGAGSASRAAASGETWGPVSEAVLPANAGAVSGGGLVDSISCPSAGNCSVVGGYIDSSGHNQGMFLSETDGKWAPAVESVDGGPGLVSCSSAGNCSAVGYLVDSEKNQEGVLFTETGGSWSAGVEAALPASAVTSNQAVQWGAISCGSPGNCVAVGQYRAAGPANRPLIVTETDGSWSAGIDPATPAPSTDAWLNSVSCASAGNCTAVGAYADDSFVSHGLLLTEAAGTWTPAVEAALPADSTNLGAELDSVSCASAGDCTAVGVYDLELLDGIDGQEFRGKGLLLTETAGSWKTGTQAPLPANADGADSVSVTYPPAVSCASVGNCSAIGGYFDDDTGFQGVLLTETAGSWAPAVEAQPANAPSGGMPVPRFLDAISCTSPGDCGALFNGRTLLTEIGGRWTTGAPPPVPANASGPGALLYSVSCGSTGSCDAVGQYNINVHREGVALIGGSPASVTLHIGTIGDGSGTVSSSPAGIDCGPTCSASFDAGTSLTLTATPAPGSYFAGWSGGSCSGDTCRPNTDVDGQTVTASFEVQPNCVVPKVRGKTVKAAESAIRAHSCAVANITHARSRTVKKGHVISQRPKHGRRLQHGARVSLLVSRGKPQRKR